MKKKIYQFTALLCFCTIMMGCGANSTQQTKSETTTDKPLVGSDRDEHGCIASAGYQWSTLLQNCIRPFEKGIRMKSSDESQGTAAYIVFNTDSSKIELFLPTEKSHPILNRKVTSNDKTTWTEKDEKSWSVNYTQNMWSINFNNEVRFVKD